MAEFLPFDPIAQHKPEVLHQFDVGSWTGGINGFGPRLARLWFRAQAAGRVTHYAADEICVHMLRMHPVEVYGSAWFE